MTQQPGPSAPHPSAPAPALADDPQAGAPRLHIRPRQGWLNDPNGLIHHDGRWHVFFQHNPHAAVHDRIHWGHVSSPDLVTWTEHPVAFGPQPGGPDRFGCWSGVAVPGLDDPTVVYSGVVDATARSTVCRRRGSADLLTWGDPVVVARTPPEVTVMRDPFVFTWRDRRLALLGARLGERTPAALLFDASDIDEWTYHGVWLTGADPGAAGTPEADIWECPQLVVDGDRAALLVSLQAAGELKEVVALVGDLHPHPDGMPRLRARTWHRTDRSTDCYAPQVLDQAPAPLLLGWVRQQDRPGPGRLAGCLTLPRRLHLTGDRLLITRHPATDALLHHAPEVLLPAGAGTAAYRLDLPPRAVVQVIDAPPGATLGLHPDRGAPVQLAAGPGTQTWLDGEVLESYPGDHDIPTTVRCDDTVSWRLTVPAGVSVRVLDLTDALDRQGAHR